MFILFIYIVGILMVETFAVCPNAKNLTAYSIQGHWYEYMQSEDYVAKGKCIHDYITPHSETTLTIDIHQMASDGTYFTSTYFDNIVGGKTIEVYENDVFIFPLYLLASDEEFAIFGTCCSGNRIKNFVIFVRVQHPCPQLVAKIENAMSKIRNLPKKLILIDQTNC